MSARTIRAPWWRRAGWPIAIAAGVLCALPVAGAVGDRQQAREAADIERRAQVHGRDDVVPEPSESIRALIADSEERVVVGRQVQDRVDPVDVAAARTALEGAEVPARLAFLPYPSDGDFGYTASGAMAQWIEGVGEDGHYVLLFTNGTTERGARGMAEEYLDADTHGQPGKALVRIAEELAIQPAAPARADEAVIDPGHDYWGGPGGGIAAGLLIGAATVLPVFAVLRHLVSRRRERTPDEQ